MLQEWEKSLFSGKILPWPVNPYQYGGGFFSIAGGIIHISRKPLCEYTLLIRTYLAETDKFYWGQPDSYAGCAIGAMPGKTAILATLSASVDNLTSGVINADRRLEIGIDWYKYRLEKATDKQRPGLITGIQALLDKRKILHDIVTEVEFVFPLLKAMADQAHSEAIQWHINNPLTGWEAEVTRMIRHHPS